MTGPYSAKHQGTTTNPGKAPNDAIKGWANKFRLQAITQQATLDAGIDPRGAE